MSQLSANLAAVHKMIERACSAPNRPGVAVRLMAVSKTQSPEAIRELIGAGQRLFGENRVQEAAGKWPQIKAQTPDIELHLIGPLQTNKVAQALKLFDVIQTLDRLRLAEKIAAEEQRQGRRLRYYIEVNLGDEPQKAGVSPQEAPAFIQHCREKLRLNVIGLMAIPPADLDPRPYFAMLKALCEQNGLPECSMGMSSDFIQAIGAGATLVRVGTALFGQRTPLR